MKARTRDALPSDAYRKPETSRPPPTSRAWRPVASVPASHTEDPELAFARRALMSRKGVLEETVAERAKERMQKSRRVRRLDAKRLRSFAWLPAGGGIAWLGSLHPSVPALVAGYTMLGIGIIVLLAKATRRLDAPAPSLDAYYLDEERPASREEILLLQRISSTDRELHESIRAWWRAPAPIRRGDVQLAVDFHRAKLKQQVAHLQREAS